MIKRTVDLVHVCICKYMGMCVYMIIIGVIQQKKDCTYRLPNSEIFLKVEHRMQSMNETIRELRSVYC